MAEVNVLADRLRPEYIEAEKLKRFLSYPLVINFAVISVTNPEYYQCIFNMLCSSSGITALLFQVVVSTFFVFPWLTICFFIGQYTKKTFLFTRFMAPLFKFAIILHCIFSPILASKLDNYPSLTKLIITAFHETKEDEALWKFCNDQMIKQLQNKTNCSVKGRGIIFPSLCHTEKSGELRPPEDVLDDLWNPVFSTIITCVLSVLKLHTFNAVLVVVMGFILLNSFVTVIFSFLRSSLEDILHCYFSSIKRVTSVSGSAGNFSSLCAWLIIGLSCSTPNLILIGSLLPVSRSPSVTAMYASFVQILMIHYLFFSYLSNVAVVAYHYTVPIECIATDETTLSFYPVLISMYREALHIHYEDQGKNGKVFMTIVSMIIFKVMELLYLAVHCLGFYCTFKTSFPIFRKWKWVGRCLILLVCVAVNFTAHLSTMSDNKYDHYFTPFSCMISLFFGFIFTFTVCTIYGPSKLNTDYMFLYGHKLTAVCTVLFTLLPLNVFACFAWRLYNWAKLEPMSIRITEGFINCNKVLYYFSVLIVMGCVFAHSILTVLRALFKGNVSKAFVASKRFGPWSPPGMNKIEERSNFHPEKALRSEKNYYRCFHSCWLNNKIIAAEIEECDRTFNEIVAEIQGVNLQNVVPEIYEKYQHVFQQYQNKVTSAPPSLPSLPPSIEQIDEKLEFHIGEPPKEIGSDILDDEVIMIMHDDDREFDQDSSLEALIEDADIPDEIIEPEKKPKVD